MKHSDPERWICIYPAYLNSLKTRQEGRLIHKDKCVPNPTYLEIRDVLMSAGFTPLLENKQYSRERSRELEFRGRIRVPLRKDDGSILNEKFPTRESILIYLGESIPNLKSRTQRPKEVQEQQQPQQQGKKGKKKK